MKLPIYLALCVSLIYYTTATVSNPCLETLGEGEYCIYSTQAITSPLVTKRNDLGFSYIYYCDSGDAARLRSLFDSIDGESITLTNTNASSVLAKLHYQEVSQLTLGETQLIYAYSPRGKSFIMDNNTKINLQIVITGGITTVGWPVILGSF